MHWFIVQLREHVELALFLSLAVGYIVGKIRIVGFQVGSVLGTLIAGLVIGQIGVTVPGAMRTVFFLMFLFAIGYRIGPQFFRSLRGSALPQVALSDAPVRDGPRAHVGDGEAGGPRRRHGRRHARRRADLLRHHRHRNRGDRHSRPAGRRGRAAREQRGRRLRRGLRLRPGPGRHPAAAARPVPDARGPREGMPGVRREDGHGSQQRDGLLRLPRHPAARLSAAGRIRRPHRRRDRGELAQGPARRGRATAAREVHRGAHARHAPRGRRRARHRRAAGGPRGFRQPDARDGGAGPRPSRRADRDRGSRRHQSRLRRRDHREAGRGDRPAGHLPAEVPPRGPGPALWPADRHRARRRARR